MTDRFQQLFKIATSFNIPENISSIKRYGKGNINDTFLVILGGLKECYILQKINKRVFKNPIHVIENIKVYENHLAAKLKDTKPTINWILPRLIQTANALDYFSDENGDIWRMFEFIDGTKTIQTIESPLYARHTGHALGMLHRLLMDLPTENLHDTLPGFHITPDYLELYTKKLENLSSLERSSETAQCNDFIEARKRNVDFLEKLKGEKKLGTFPIHGDPKVDNILFDEKSGKALSFIDLDTFKPGLLLYDLGDCLRSACNIHGEDAELDFVDFNVTFAKKILEGYAEAIEGTKLVKETRYFYEAVWLMTFELGIRFLTDHISGDTYFKTSKKGQNLERALVQFSLVKSIENKESEIRELLL